MTAEHWADGLLCVTVVAAFILDVTTQRVPNVLTLPAVVAGIALQSAISLNALLIRAGLVVLVTLAGYIVFAVGILGGGDVKLVAAIAALKGAAFLRDTLLTAALIGVVVALFVLARRKMLAPLLRRVGSTAWGMARYGLSPEPLPDTGHRIPYVIVLAPAALTALFGRYYGLGSLRIW